MLGTPVLLEMLGIVGTAAMIWVGGCILVHGLEMYGLAAIGHTIHHATEVAGYGFPGRPDQDPFGSLSLAHALRCPGSRPASRMPRRS